MWRHHYCRRGLNGQCECVYGWSGRESEMRSRVSARTDHSSLLAAQCSCTLAPVLLRTVVERTVIDAISTVRATSATGVTAAIGVWMRFAAARLNGTEGVTNRTGEKVTSSSGSTHGQTDGRNNRGQTG